MNRLERHNLRNGILFALPWIIGFLVLQVFPIFYSFYLSLTRYNGLGAPVFIGLQNFKTLFSDTMAGLAAVNTLYYTFWLLPIGVTIGISLALAMNQKVREVAVYRAIFYLPSVLPSFAMVFIWILFTNPQYGILNRLFVSLGLPYINWTGDPKFTKPSLVILAQYGAGGPALIFLASLRSIPKELYESADLDGAGAFRKLFSITIPMITPVILYDIIWGISGGLQAFTQAYLMSSSAAGQDAMAGPANSLLFYVFYVYRSAFMYSKMGYAAALSVMLFIASLVIAFIVFRWGRSWVFYEAERK
ncbi:MAG: sugar ABC transporter permease [Spirochaetaceae bacterium]|jgi:multiple sugar transport system permease protein|nr:sugar ABC transporter permease [Spirochaetaceae bacterium]